MRSHVSKKRLVCGLIALLGIQTAVGTTLAVTVHTASGQPLAGAVVTAWALDSGSHSNAPVKAVMDQIDLAFTPDLLVIPAGSTVRFPNTDSVSHQIYSFSPAKRFQLPLYHGTPYPPVRFDQPGLVTLGCNIHDNMLAYVLVTDATFFGRTDAAGVWLATVPPGKYRIAVWHPRMREGLDEVKQEFEVTDGASAATTLRIGKPLKPVPLDARSRSRTGY